MAASDYVTLRGGLCVPLAPMLLALQLEERGVHMQRDGENVCVKPWSRVTEQERAELKRWKTHILALLDYQAPEVA